jgi:hypothetical protein
LAQEALAMGLVDAVVEDVEQTAVALGADLAADRKPPVRTRDRQDGLQDVVRFQADVAAARAAAQGRLPAPGRIVDCVEAAMLLPFDRGLVVERAAFEDLAASPESVGLRRAFFAERRAAVFPEAGALAHPVSHVGLVGLGETGAALAMLLLQAGLRVTAVVKGSGPLEAGLSRVARLQEDVIAAGRLPDMVALLLACGAPVNASEEGTRLTPLHVASDAATVEVAQAVRQETRLAGPHDAGSDGDVSPRQRRLHRRDRPAGLGADQVRAGLHDRQRDLHRPRVGGRREDGASEARCGRRRRLRDDTAVGTDDVDTGDDTTRTTHDKVYLTRAVGHRHGNAVGARRTAGNRHGPVRLEVGAGEGEGAGLVGPQPLGADLDATLGTEEVDVRRAACGHAGIRQNHAAFGADAPQ